MANGGGKKGLVAVVALVVIVAAGGYILRTQFSGGGAGSTPEEMVAFELGAPAFYVCEACKATHAQSQRPTPFKCPKCGKEAMVESVRYTCGGCGKVVEVFRRRTIMSSDGKRPVGFEIKMPGGEWQRTKPPKPTCPACGNDDPATLQPKVPEGML